jgi:hypothetical protein
MKLKTHWRVWYLATDGIWHYVTYELGNISSLWFDDLEAAESAARRLTEGKDVVEVEVREERSVLSFPGAAHGTVEG